RPRQPLDIGSVLSVLCPGSFVLVGVLLSLLGVWLLAGHAEVVVTGHDISSTWGLGPFTWQRRRPRQQLRRLVIAGTSRTPGAHAGGEGRPAAAGGETGRGRPVDPAPVLPAGMAGGAGRPPAPPLRHRRRPAAGRRAPGRPGHLAAVAAPAAGRDWQGTGRDQ